MKNRLTDTQIIYIKDIKKLANKAVSIMLLNNYATKLRNLNKQRIWNEANAKIQRIINLK